jgi:hypothetical protein
MNWPLVYLIVISVCIIDALVTLAALHPRFNPRLAFRQRARRFRIVGRGRAHQTTHNGCNAA